MAVFPRAIKSFPTHHNLIDDVKAEHVNDLQDEVVAIQEVLGPLVNEIADLSLEIDQDALDDAGALQTTLTKFKDIAAQLLSLRRGEHLPVFSATTTDKVFPGEVPSVPTVPYRLLTFPKASTDTHNSYNGYGFTAPKTGFYLIRAQVNWDTSVLPLSAGFGTYSSVISINGSGNSSYSRYEHSNPDPQTVQNSPLFCDVISRGTKVSLVVNQNTHRSARVISAFLSSICFRELP
jgi:hypothetical protein